MLLVCCVAGAGIGAEEYDLLPSIAASSVYWDPVLESWGNETEWLFSPTDLPRGESGYALEVKRKGAAAPTVLLRYGGAGRLRKVTRFLTEHGRTRRIAESFSGPLALSEGFPVPYDYLAPHDMELRNAKVRKQAGGKVFSRPMKREIRGFTFEQALEDGLIREEVKPFVAGKQLRMIVVTKNGAIAVRQLWAEGMPWWVYEESPFRKSWLVGIEE